MFRKTFIALVALAALTGLCATQASARGHGGHGSHIGGFAHSGGHWGGHWGGGPHFGHFHHRGFFGPRFGFYNYPYYGYPYASYDNGCYRWRRVPTRWGWRLRRVWVCGYRYY